MGRATRDVDAVRESGDGREGMRAGAPEAQAGVQGTLIHLPV
jgi:hypothetical protein